ncbi:response regulator transcription factor [Paenibacillus humicola]|uniref:response regulator transcription factor n=1 Tax=Paenibacillus humicola TaxID=3110540 RepID=UPI00237BD00F|nr:response regulator transcription factor [Paenibacillus humicola]
MKRRPYFLKLLAFSLLLAMIPVAIQGVLSYHKASSAIQDKVLESNRLLLQQSLNHTEQILKSIETTMLNYVNSTEMLNAMNSPIVPAQFPLFTRLNNAVSSMSFYEYGVRRVYLINFAKDWVIDGEGTYHLGQIDDRSKYDKLLSRLSSPSAWVPNEGYIPSTDANRSGKDDNSLLLVQKIPQYSTHPTGLAIVVFPESALSGMIAGSEKLGTFLITDRKNRVIARSDAGHLAGTSLGDAVLRDIRMQQTESGFKTLKESGEQVGVTFIRSSYNDWTYLSISPFRQITKDSRAIGSIVLVICLVMLLFIVILALLGSRKMYRPIAQIYEFAAESGLGGRGDELELIRRQFLSMRNSQFELKDQLNIQLAQLKDFFLQRLLRGELGTEEAREKCLSFQIPEDWRMLTVFTTRIDSLANTRFQEKDSDLLMFALNNIVRELIAPKTRFPSVLLNTSQAAVIGHAHEDEEEIRRTMYAMCEDIQATLRQYLGVQVSIGISKPYRRLVDTSRAYEEAQEALGYRIKYGDESILYLKDVQPDEEDNMLPAFPRHVETELIAALNIGDKEAAEAQFNQFLDWLLAQPVSYREQQVYLARILLDLLKIVQDMRISAKHLLEGESSIFTRLFSLRNSEELRKWFLNEVIDDILELLKNRREIKYVKVAEELAAMVRAEYDTSLSLELCADRLGVHPSYLKRVLRKELDTNFSDYLSMYRLQKARELLLETDLRIADIAERLQYNNSQNFIRYFRRMEGVTPGEYRKKRNPAMISGYTG